MKLNNKGITLVEIIISIVLISLVLIFLFSLLITVNDINIKSETNSSYLINKALIIKNIEEDIKDATSITIENCNIEDFFDRYDDPEYISDLSEKNKMNICMKFIIGGDSDNPAYLGIYYYKRSGASKESDEYVISYIHSAKNIRATRTLPNYAEYNVDNNGNSLYLSQLEIKTSNSPSNDPYKYEDLPVELSGLSTINIPILGPDGKDYSILIPFSSN